MDADRRHELKTNELGEALQSARESMTDKRVGYAAVAIIVVAAMYLVWQWRSHMVETSRRLAWEAVESVNTNDPATADAAAAQLRSIAADTADPRVRAAAELRLGVALKQKALGTLQLADLQPALQVFESLAARADAPPAIRAAARYNVGQIHENRFEIDQARAAYQQLRDDPALAGHVFQTIAARRLTALADLGERIVFQPGFPASASQPAEVGPPQGAIEVRVPAEEVTFGAEGAPESPATDAPVPAPSPAPAPDGEAPQPAPPVEDEAPAESPAEPEGDAPAEPPVEQP